MGEKRTRIQYSGEFKKQVIETMHREHLSCREAARQFGIADQRVCDWERIYLTEGPEMLCVERRGRKSKGRPPKLPEKVEKDLIAENQRLRAELEYLKNCRPWFWRESDANRKSNGDPGTEAGTRSEIAVGNRSNPKSDLLLPRKAHGSGG